MTTSEDRTIGSSPQHQQQHPHVQHGPEHFDAELEYLPSESQMVLLCLDYLRDVRRAYGSNPQDMLDVEGLHSDWLTLAVYALSRSFAVQGAARLRRTGSESRDDAAGGNSTNYNHITMPVFNDAWMDSHKVLMESSPAAQQEMMNPPATPNLSQLPTLEEMTKSILYKENPYPNDDEDGDDDTEDEDVSKSGTKKRNKNSTKSKRGGDDHFAETYAWYEYDDCHPSNANRFYLLNGLASSVNGRGPLSLGEIAAAGLCQLQSKSRSHAEEDLVYSPLFEQFVSAVKAKGFFQDPEHDAPRDDPKEEEERLVLKKAVYDERMSKVIGKFRHKLAAKVDLHEASGGADAVSSAIADFQHNRRMKRVLKSRKLKSSGVALRPQPSPAPSTLMPSLSKQMLESSSSSTAAYESPALARLVPGAAEAQAQEDAERLKSQGNAHMQKKEYDAASDCYTQALRISPSGPQSHVYFSNRAAALLSMKKFDQAILDSERALALKPTYGKAHARLGLAHFLLGDYRQAMEAYTVALKYEPDNKSSRSYLEKAAKKLAAAPDGGKSDSTHGAHPASSSFSVVSEWDKSNNKAHSVEAVTGGGRGKGHSRLPAMPPPGVANETAEKHKNKGNSFMANREYQQALESYTSALEFAPNGPQSHVYYSNRAAALCYLERYLEAAQDSERALGLKPNYGKAHARLGLSRFFLHDYEGAVVAYTAALQYDPDNAASKSYLAKAKLKLERQQHEASIDVTQEARRLMEDPDMMLMARKALSASSDLELLNDPDMRHISRRAMNDPTMKEALQHIHQVDKMALSPTNGGGSSIGAK